MADAERQTRQLRKVLNAVLGAAIVVGGAIGVGILRTPGTIAGNLVDPWLALAVWLSGGIIAALGANIFAELATALPKAGGPVVYAERAFGSSAGAAVGWSDAIISIASLATISVAIAEFVLPGRGASLVHAAAVAILLLFATLTWFGLKTGAQTQQWLSFAKVGGLALLALAAFVVIPVATPTPGDSLPRPSWLTILSSAVIVGEVYAGWNSAVYFSEEDHDSARNMPRALFGGIAAITVAYVLFNAALLYAIPVTQLAGAKLAAADLAGRLLGGSGELAVRLFSIVSLCGIVNVMMMYTPRIFFGMGRSGIAPKALQHLNRHGSPGTALIVMMVPTIALAAFLSFDFLYAVTAFLGIAVNLASYVSFFVLRQREPELARPYRARGHPWLPAAVTLLNFGLLIAFCAAEPIASATAVTCLVIAALLAHFGSRHR